MVKLHTFFLSNLIIFFNIIFCCIKNTNKDACIYSGEECCYVRTPSEDFSCMEIKEEAYILGSDEITKAIRKEMMGFYSPNNEEFFFSGECKNGVQISWLEENLKLTDDDENILYSQNYCLNYHQSVVNGKNFMINKDTCLKAEILKSSKNVGLECSFYEITIVTEGYGERTIKTCNFFSPELTNSKNIDKRTDLLFNQIVNSFSNGFKFSSYKLKISYSNKNLATYDSETGEITNTSSANIFLISKYSFLFLLLLILYF